jgi:hypothetical protein
MKGSVLYFILPGAPVPGYSLLRPLRDLTSRTSRFFAFIRGKLVFDPRPSAKIRGKFCFS